MKIKLSRFVTTILGLMLFSNQQVIAESLFDKLKNNLLENVDGQLKNGVEQSTEPKNIPDISKTENSNIHIGEADVSAQSQTSTSNGGYGPDVLGIRLGMTPVEVAEILKKYPTFNHVKQIEQSLQYKSITGKYIDIPGGKFLSSTFVTKDNSIDVIVIHYSPVPGSERVVGVQQTQGYYGSENAPLFEVFNDAILKKYGKPSYEGTKGNYGWTFDSEFTINDKYEFGCSGLNDERSLIFAGGGEILTYGVTDPPHINWALALKDPQQNGKSITEYCGNARLSITLSSNVNSQHIVDNLFVRLSGFSDAIEGKRKAEDIVKKYEKKMLDQDTEKAKQNQQAPML